ncbi:hypothetical protein O181_093483 [Austropuccinia psidii MF-1]|uniref:Uncharacterized protein n=1 Tax=Austropuccinia psidii MF-1 TaxID=1389203 RepID=A0A9Q3J1B7_9BASI|nr:hypothetical protein [Austropuccinia psidii MF-1]
MSRVIVLLINSNIINSFIDKSYSLPSNRADTTTRSLSGYIQSQPEGLKQCIATQIVPYSCRSVEKIHEFLSGLEKIPGPSQHLQVTQWMASIDGKEKHDDLNSRMEAKQPSSTQANSKNSPSSEKQQFQHKKAATSSEQGQRHGTSHRNLQLGLQNPKYSAGSDGKCLSDGQNNDAITEKGGSHTKISEMISDIFNAILELCEAINAIKSHIYDKNSSICNNYKTNNLSLSQINKTLMCFETFVRTIKAFDNDNSFGKNLNEQYAMIKDLTDKYSKFNIDEIIETRMKKAIDIIKEDDKKFLDDIANLFTEVKIDTIALNKCFDIPQQEVSKLTMKLNQVTSDSTRKT